MEISELHKKYIKEITWVLPTTKIFKKENLAIEIIGK
jgi:hypothetical protein